MKEIYIYYLCLVVYLFLLLLFLMQTLNLIIYPVDFKFEFILFIQGGP